MASEDGTPQVENLFAVAPRNKPQRTYSHRGKGGRLGLLPALKPTTDVPALANTGVRLQKFRIGRANSWELRPVTPAVTNGLQGVQAEEGGENEDNVEHDLVEESARSAPGDVAGANATQGRIYQTQSTHSHHHSCD